MSIIKDKENNTIFIALQDKISFYIKKSNKIPVMYLRSAECNVSRYCFAALI